MELFEFSCFGECKVHHKIVEFQFDYHLQVTITMGMLQIMLGY